MYFGTFQSNGGGDQIVCSYWDVLTESPGPIPKMQPLKV